VKRPVLRSFVSLGTEYLLYCRKMRHECLTLDLAAAESGASVVGYAFAGELAEGANSLEVAVIPRLGCLCTKHVATHVSHLYAQHVVPRAGDKDDTYPIEAACDHHQTARIRGTRVSANHKTTRKAKFSRMIRWMIPEPGLQKPRAKAILA
jgi:hypothetical protein